MIDVITFNVQRKEPSDYRWIQDTIDVLQDLRLNYPKALFCFQEVSPEIAQTLIGSNHLRDGENIILAPQGTQLLCPDVISSPVSRSKFLTCKWDIWEKIFHVCTGKLPHGIGPLTAHIRRQVFSHLLAQLPKESPILAFDTNAFTLKGVETLVNLARESGLRATHNPQGTYDLWLLEPKDFLHVLGRFIGQKTWFHPELDFIFYDFLLRLRQSRVLDAKKTSDHQPVLAQFSL